MKNGTEVEEIEMQLLLEGIARRYGIDFRDYAPASVRRRIRATVREEKLSTISALQDRVLHDAEAMERLAFAITRNDSAVFRDPEFFVALRRSVVPMLATYPFVRVWHAGCSTGEDVVATAIVLQEEGIYDRCRIYATDVSETALRRAKDAVFPSERIPEYEKNYVQSGGTKRFADYYTASGPDAMFTLSLKKNVVYARHNLAIDASFNEFNLIICRNVMISYNRALQDRVHGLLYQSLGRFGVLGLGSGESLRRTPHEGDYEELSAPERLYRKVRG